MAQQQSLQELFKKNKMLAIGVPIILLILLIDTFVLRPARRAKELEKRGIKAVSTATPEQRAAKAAGVAPKAPIAAPAPISQPTYPPLSPNIVNRFTANSVYPHADGRNIFAEIEKPVMIVDAVQEIVEEVIDKPAISYHGFYTVGNDKIAILRKDEEVLLTKVGSKVRRTSYRLASVTPEKVIISDTTDQVRDFEISLSDETESN